MVDGMTEPLTKKGKFNDIYGSKLREKSRKIERCRLITPNIVFRIK